MATCTITEISLAPAQVEQISFDQVETLVREAIPAREILDGITLTPEKVGGTGYLDRFENQDFVDAGKAVIMGTDHYGRRFVAFLVAPRVPGDADPVCVFERYTGSPNPVVSAGSPRLFTGALDREQFPVLERLFRTCFVMIPTWEPNKFKSYELVR